MPTARFVLVVEEVLKGISKAIVTSEIDEGPNGDRRREPIQDAK